MDIIKLLPEYLDLGVEQEEMVSITQAALAKRIRDLKLAIAETVVQARACTLLDNLEGSHQALQRARQLQKEYHHFLAEWTRLHPKAPYERSESGTQKPVLGEVEGTKPGPEVEPKRNPDTIGAIGAEWQRLSQPRPQVEAPQRPRPVGGDPDKACPEPRRRIGVASPAPAQVRRRRIEGTEKG